MRNSYQRGRIARVADEMSVRGHHVPQRLGNYPVPQPQDVQQDPVM